MIPAIRRQQLVVSVENSKNMLDADLSQETSRMGVIHAVSFIPGVVVYEDNSCVVIT